MILLEGDVAVKDCAHNGEFSTRLARLTPSPDTAKLQAIQHSESCFPEAKAIPKKLNNTRYVPTNSI